jgi:hypothetical protein
MIEVRRRYSPVEPGKSDQFTLVSIDMFSGRSLQAKKALYGHS